MVYHELAIIGGGPAGMAAAAAAWDAGVRDIIIIEREPELGGILRQCIHSGFGLHSLGQELTGPEYAWHYACMVSERRISVLYNTTVLSLSRERILQVQSPAGMQMIQAEAVILAMGCRERSRGALNIGGTRPAGVYSAGTAQKLMNCDGFRVGSRVVILGSGDIGLIMARRLTLEGAKVEAVCELMPYSGGLKRNIVQCLEDFSIPLYLSTTVCRIHGKSRVSGVTVCSVDAHRNPIPGSYRHIKCDTLLLSVGLIPENELTRGAGISIDPITSGPIVDENCETEAEGIFACGNVLHVHDLVDYVSREAQRAGENAANRILKKYDPSDTVAVHPGDGVRYVVPQRVHSGKEIDLFFRVAIPGGKSQCVVSSGEKQILKKRFLRTSPGEMLCVHLPANSVTNISGGIRVSVEETE